MEEKYTVVLEEYIPLKVVNSVSENDVDCYTYGMEDTSLLEFAVGHKSKEVRRITLLLSREYEIVHEDMPPCVKLDEADTLDYSNVICDTFKTLIYNDGVRIRLSNRKSKKMHVIGNVCFEITDEGTIAELRIAQMTNDEVWHTKNELDLQ